MRCAVSSHEGGVGVAGGGGGGGERDTVRMDECVSAVEDGEESNIAVPLSSSLLRRSIHILQRHGRLSDICAWKVG